MIKTKNHETTLLTAKDDAVDNGNISANEQRTKNTSYMQIRVLYNQRAWNRFFQIEDKTNAPGWF